MTSGTPSPPPPLLGLPQIMATSPHPPHPRKTSGTPSFFSHLEVVTNCSNLPPAPHPQKIRPRCFPNRSQIPPRFRRRSFPDPSQIPPQILPRSFPDPSTAASQIPPQIPPKSFPDPSADPTQILPQIPPRSLGDVWHQDTISVGNCNCFGAS